ncbi:MAG: type II toxin-antitoxin system Phd/YefM family antitoxin [Acidobacteriota bacterium]
MSSATTHSGFQILEKDGEKQFVVLPYEDFLKIEETLADYHDLQLLRAAKAEEVDAPALGLADVKTELGLD